RGPGVLRAAAGPQDPRGNGLRRCAAHGRSNRVPAVRSGGRDVRSRVRVLGAGRIGGEQLMQIRVWGCRGSVAAPGAETVKYGGNTSCVEVTLASGHALVLDAGTGMRPLGVLMRNAHPKALPIPVAPLPPDPPP